MVDGLRDEVAAAFDALREQPRGFATLRVVALGDDDAADDEAAGLRGDADRARERERVRLTEAGRPTTERKSIFRLPLSASQSRHCRLVDHAERLVDDRGESEERRVVARIDRADERERARQLGAAGLVLDVVEHHGVERQPGEARGELVGGGRDLLGRGREPGRRGAVEEDPLPGVRKLCPQIHSRTA